MADNADELPAITRLGEEDIADLEREERAEILTEAADEIARVTDELGRKIGRAREARETLRTERDSSGDLSEQERKDEREELAALVAEMEALRESLEAKEEQVRELAVLDEVTPESTEALAEVVDQLSDLPRGESTEEDG